MADGSAVTQGIHVLYEMGQIDCILFSAGAVDDKIFAIFPSTAAVHLGGLFA